MNIYSFLLLVYNYCNYLINSNKNVTAKMLLLNSLVMHSHIFNSSEEKCTCTVLWAL